MWIEDELTGQAAYSHASGQYYIGSWLPIMGNSKENLMVDGSLDAVGDTVRVSDWNPIAATYLCDYGIKAANGQFWEGCRDENGKIWFSPGTSPVIIKFDPVTKLITPYDHGYTKDTIYPPFGILDSLCFDPQYINGKIYMTPGTCPDLLEVDPETGVITSYPHPYTYRDPNDPANANGLFQGSVAAGDYLFMLPQFCSDLGRFNTVTKEFASFFVPGAVCIFGAAYVNGYVWAIAGWSIFRITPDTGNIKEIPIPFTETGWACCGKGSFDGTFIWWSPFKGPLIGFNPITEQFRKYNMVGEAAHVLDLDHDGLFWGTIWKAPYLWLLPQNNNILVRFEPATGEMRQYPTGFGWGAWTGAVWDETTQAFYMVPSWSSYIAEIRPPA